MLELWKTVEYKENHAFISISSEEQQKRGYAGAIKRAKNYASGKTAKKPPRIVCYKDICIVKDGTYKTVKANQVPAYVKCGWVRCK
jgi:hypothetical protein